MFSHSDCWDLCQIKGKTGTLQYVEISIENSKVLLKQRVYTILPSCLNLLKQIVTGDTQLLVETALALSSNTHMPLVCQVKLLYLAFFCGLDNRHALTHQPSSPSIPCPSIWPPICWKEPIFSQVKPGGHLIVSEIRIYLLKLLWGVVSSSIGDRQGSCSHGATRDFGSGYQDSFSTSTSWPWQLDQDKLIIHFFL